jgi:hypothetical protein
MVSNEVFKDPEIVTYVSAAQDRHISPDKTPHSREITSDDAAILGRSFDIHAPISEMVALANQERERQVALNISKLEEYKRVKRF